MKLKLLYKKYIRSLFGCQDSYCKRCGSKVFDFATPEHTWTAIQSLTDDKFNVLCANCFIEIANKHQYRVKMFSTQHQHEISMWKIYYENGVLSIEQFRKLIESNHPYVKFENIVK